MIRTPPPPTTPSFEKSAKPLLLALKPSLSWQLFIILLHVLCVVAVFIAAISLWLQLLCVAIVIASFAYHQSQSSVISQLVWRSGNRWFVDDEPLACELTSINFFSRWLVILSLRPIEDKSSLITKLKHTRKFVIPFDALDKNTFRLLRVRLRIEGFELLNPAEEETIK